MINEERYYDFHWQQKRGRTIEDPYIAEKINIILRIIPKDVRTIADIGCGDGIITNALAEKNYEVIGIDRSQEALNYLSKNILPINSSADHLPLPDKSVDLVLSSEMLEHLPDNIINKVVSEIKRVSKKYILITVPNKEKLRKRYTKCSSCGSEFHIYLHLRSFSIKTLKKYFDDCAIKFSNLIGVPEPKSFNIISYLKNKLANSYFIIDQKIICPGCGQITEFSLSKNIIQKIITLSLDRLEYTLNFLLNRKPEPFWLVVLFVKNKE